MLPERQCIPRSRPDALRKPARNTSVKGGSFPGRAGIGFTDISPQIKCLVGEWYKGDRQICLVIRADIADTAEFPFTDTACGTVTVEETADTALGQDLHGCIYACAQPAGIFVPEAERNGIQKSPARQVKANSSTDNWKNNLPLA